VLGNYIVAAQPMASRVALSSTELVSINSVVFRMRSRVPAFQMNLLYPSSGRRKDCPEMPVSTCQTMRDCITRDNPRDETTNFCGVPWSGMHADPLQSF
jgi:hypothetical protein